MPHPSVAAALLEAAVFKAGRSWLTEHGFVELFPPRVVRASGACENIDTLFHVSADGTERWWTSPTSGDAVPAYLAQTGQLYLEALVPALGKTFCVGPSFRAEPRIDDRHLTEFTMTEIEFAGNFEQLLHYIQEFIKAIAGYLVAHRDEAIAHWGLTANDIKRLEDLAQVFPRVTYDEAITILQRQGEEITWGDDISSAREKILVNTFGGQPIFITHYPDPQWAAHQSIEVEKFFNMLPDPERPGRVQSADLILPFAGESVGSAARVHDLGVLKERLAGSKMFKRLVKKGGTMDDFAWYFEQLAHAAVPHAGCGFGMARILQWLQGKDSIVDSVTFPSHRGRLI